MSIDKNKLIQDVLQLNATRAAIIQMPDIKFSEELRQLCAQNSCGKYGSNWMCPPAVGPYDELKARTSRFKQGLVLQTVSQLEDSFDFEGMLNAKKVHERVFRDILDILKNKYRMNGFLPLSAGACEVCPQCTYPSGEPCRFPDRAVASVESYGIDVTSLVHSCGIPYNNGKDTVSYVGLILFNDELV